MDLQTITSGVQALCDDDDKTYITDDYVKPRINIAYNELYNKLVNTGYQFEEFTVELPSVSAGLTDLSSFSTSGKPLELLIQPRMLEWKLPGQDPTNYQPADGPLDKQRDVIAAPQVDSFAWKHATLYITPFSTALDLRVTGDFLFNALLQPGDVAQIAQNAGVVLQYMTAHLIAIIRGNPGWMEQYEKKANDSFYELQAAMVKGDQMKVRRIGRMSRTRIAGRTPTAWSS